VGEGRAGLPILATVSFLTFLKYFMTDFLGITPGVKPDDLKFYFEELHRLGGS
jgi:hypothetical protein